MAKDTLLFWPDMTTEEAYDVSLENLRELLDWAHTKSADLHEEYALYLFARVERMLVHGQRQERAMPRRVEPDLYIHPDQQGTLGYR